MVYVVIVGFNRHRFEFPDSAMSFAQISKNSSMDGDDVKIEILTNEEFEKEYEPSEED